MKHLQDKKRNHHRWVNQKDESSPDRGRNEERVKTAHATRRKFSRILHHLKLPARMNHHHQ